MNYLGLDKQSTAGVADELNLLLANYHVYYQNLRNFHWNVSGENFFDLHEKFELLYREAHENIDEVAERIITLRHRPLSNLSDYLAQATVQEAGNLTNDREMVAFILENHRILIEQLHHAHEAANEMGDHGTADLTVKILVTLEKKSWMLNAWAARKRETATA